MKKKVLVFVLLAVFVMVGVSMASAVNTAMVSSSDEKKLDKLDSPLFETRTRNAIQEKTTAVKQRIYNFFVKFFENRIFFILPSVPFLNNDNDLPPSEACTKAAENPHVISCFTPNCS